jgi:precorrin-2 dehydrogenase / sirohydrochlorin ferrochelatase
VLPLQLKVKGVPILLAGQGEKYALRLAYLSGSGADCLTCAEGEAAWRPLLTASTFPYRLLFLAGIPEAPAETIAHAARAHGVLTNVEDVPQLCDFYVPAIVRRGDLLLSISSGGRASGLSKILREYLETRVFPPIWSERMEHLIAERLAARRDGLDSAGVMTRLRQKLANEGWLS